MKNKNKNQKPTLLKSTIFSGVVAAAAVMILLNILFVIGLYFVMVSPKFDIYSRKTIVFMGLISVLNVIVLALLIVLRKSYETRVLKKIVYPLRDIERHISNLVHGDYDEPIMYEKDDEIGDLFKSVDNVRVQLSEYRLLEQQAEAQKQIHISGLMHDIATPVTRINGCASMISDGMVTDPQDIKRFALIILQNTEDINLMLKSLAAVEKYNSTDIQLHMQPIDLAEVLQRFICDLQLELSSKNISIKFENRCKSAAVCLVDVKSCKRALLNIINNSIKYKKPDKDCEITVSIEDGDDGNVLFSLADNGSGVEQGSESMIFEMFYRGDSVRRNISEGNGLGLFLTKEILMANNAKVWAENNGDGLTVYILFKRTDADPVKWYK